MGFKNFGFVPLWSLGDMGKREIDESNHDIGDVKADKQTKR
jgi:hypothetical protein